jgi:glucokinase
LENDANACALAEWRYGAGQGFSNLVFLTFGTGMGAGLILDGRLYRGSNDMAGEIGHVRMEETGPVGYGKSGSFEGFCSGAGIASLARQRVLSEWKNSRIVGFCKSEDERLSITTKIVGEAALAGDPVAIDIIETSAAYLGKGLAILIDILNPECIIIGSIFSRLEHLFRQRMEAAICDESIARSASVCRIVPAALGEELGLYAAVSVAVAAAASNKTTKNR